MTVAIVGTIGLVLVALIGVFGSKITTRLKAVQEHVQNSHSINMRDEFDTRHDEVRHWFGYLTYRQDETDKHLAEMRQYIELNTDRIELNTDRISNIETTLGGPQ